MESDACCIPFYIPDELVHAVVPGLKSSPHFTVHFKNVSMEAHQRVVVNLPDRILSLDNITDRGSQSDYRGVFFNLTPGEYQGNLYCPPRLLGDAFAITLGKVLDKPTALPK